MSKKKPDRDRIEHKEPAVLPAREALTLISPTPGSSSGFLPDLGSFGAPTPDAADQHSAATDAQGDASGHENVTSDGRNDHIESSDSASSET
jgi:hypothetical protein